ncbi:MAG TPA: helix-turn-helix transcriptional regulator [Stellaceae bacterium]|nr:helix-turn-helix transcriptional regulator [Stellaceae bacterium]
MTTAEVADYLRLKQRKIYDLVRSNGIPCARVTGKLLFPKAMIDLWVAQHTEYAGPRLAAAPPVFAGSHDPLLEGALRESGCGLALLAGGSTEGLRRLAERRAVLAGIHVVGPDGGYNVEAVRSLSLVSDIVLIEWAQREQGLVVAAGNPRGLRGLADLKRRRVRVARRQDGAGAQILLVHLLKRAGIRLEDLRLVEPANLTETDLAACVLDGKADCGLAIRAVAQRFGLDFIPLQVERFDLALRRHDYFEPPVQALLRFARGPVFLRRAAELGGYDVSGLGTVRYNGA